jgi:hypothetical protein
MVLAVAIRAIATLRRHGNDSFHRPVPTDLQQHYGKAETRFRQPTASKPEAERKDASKPSESMTSGKRHGQDKRPSLERNLQAKHATSGHSSAGSQNPSAIPPCHELRSHYKDKLVVI